MYWPEYNELVCLRDYGKYVCLVRTPYGVRPFLNSRYRGFKANNNKKLKTYNILKKTVNAYRKIFSSV